MQVSDYSKAFHSNLHERSLRSARQVVPLLIELIDPDSVVDVGCGLGSWLRAFRELGVNDAVGIDGSYVDLDHLAIPSESFHSHDLTTPFSLGRQFDLVLSLEVAEHLDESVADTFVSSLTKLGSAVLFSAAIPTQAGVRHVNLQWQDYWAERFAARGFAPIDWLRGRIWENRDVDWWYAQNTLLYVHRDRHEAVARRASSAGEPVMPLRLVHPNYLSEYAEALTRQAKMTAQVASAIPRNGALLLADGGKLGIENADGKILPFVERDGVYWGAPADDAQALRELDRMRAAGASRIAFTNDTIWWLEHYRRFGESLACDARQSITTSEITVFDLVRS